MSRCFERRQTLPGWVAGLLVICGESALSATDRLAHCVGPDNLQGTVARTSWRPPTGGVLSNPEYAKQVRTIGFSGVKSEAELAIVDAVAFQLITVGSAMNLVKDSAHDQARLNTVRPMATSRGYQALLDTRNTLGFRTLHSWCANDWAVQADQVKVRVHWSGRGEVRPVRVLTFVPAQGRWPYLLDGIAMVDASR